MATAAIIASLLLAQAPAQADVAFEELSANQNEAAIARIEGNDSLDQADPARLINLGIAHARQGDEALAREMFMAALRADRFDLETATGAWIDSRKLARRAIAQLDSGAYDSLSRTAMR